MFTTNTKMKNAADKLYQRAMLMINGEIESDFMLETTLHRAARMQHAFSAGELGIHFFLAANSTDEYHHAVEYLLKGKNGGHLLSRLYYANCLVDGLGIEKNARLATLELEKFIEEIKTIKKNKISVVQQITESRLNENFCQALIALAHRYVYGDGVSPNMTKAMLLLSNAEQLGSKIAKHDFAILMFQGISTSKDSKDNNKRAKIWLQKLEELAKEKYAPAQKDLAFFYYYGSPLFPDAQRDVEKAKLFFWEVALGGDYDCFYYLSKIYVDTHNLPLANQLLQIGALIGSKIAMLDYGKLLFNKDGATDPEKILGMHYMKTVADTGDDKAQCEYGKIVLQHHDLVTAEQREDLCAEGFIYLRRSARTNMLAKLELAEALMKHPGGNLRAAIEEARLNLQAIIEHRIAENDISYSSFTSIQNEAKVMNAVSHVLIADLHTAENLALSVLDEKSANTAITDISRIRHRHKRNQQPKSKLTKGQPPRRRRPPVDYTTREEMPNMLDALPVMAVDLPASPVTVNRAAPVEPLLIPATASDIPGADGSMVYEPVYSLLPYPLPDVAIAALEKLEARGYCAYVVGGLPRNMLRGVATVADDIDIVTDAPMAVIEEEFNQERHLHMPWLCRFECNGRSFDVVTRESLGQALQADALRRDFTVNALYANARGIVIDPLGRGISDLSNPACQLQPILPLTESFMIDPFRVLRYQHFLTCNLSGDLTAAQITQHMRNLHSTLASYRGKIQLSDEAICEKVRLYEIFDSLVCKFFMNGKALQMFDLLNRHQFFDIFFQAELLVEEQLWLQWRFQKMDENGRLSKPGLYTMFLAAILKNKLLQKADVYARLDSAPFPCALRWRTQLLDEVGLWMREKHLFMCLPAIHRDSMYEKTNYDLAQARYPAKTPVQHYSMPLAQPAQQYQTFWQPGLFGGINRATAELAPVQEAWLRLAVHG